MLGWGTKASQRLNENAGGVIVCKRREDDVGERGGKRRYDLVDKDCVHDEVAEGAVREHARKMVERVFLPMFDVSGLVAVHGR